MATVNLYLDRRFICKGTAVLKLQINHHNSQRFLSTAFRVQPEFWDPATGTVTSGPGAAKTNSLIALMLSTARNRVCILELSGKLDKMKADDVRDELAAELFGRKRRSGNFFIARMEMYRDVQTKEGTREIYDRSIKALRAFDSGVDELTFDEISVDYLKQFYAHCAKTMKVNSISIIMRCIRRIFNDAIDNGVTQSYPFRKFKIKQEATRKRALSIDSLRDLLQRPVEGWQEQYRDLFFLSFYLIGINISDLLTASHGSIVDGRLEYRRNKTGKLYSIKLEPEAEVLIRKYYGKKYLLSPLDHQCSVKEYRNKMNHGLKTIGRELGYQGKVIKEGPYGFLSTYWARHSWATIARHLGIPVDTIAQALGHSDRSHAVTMIYINPDTRLVDEANRKVINYLLEKKQSLLKLSL